VAFEEASSNAIFFVTTEHPAVRAEKKLGPEHGEVDQAWH
jgi:hypothetical protein